MNGIGLYTIGLPSVTTEGIGWVGKSEPKPPFWDVDNILMEDGDSLLNEDGGAFLLESIVSQLSLV